MTRHSDVDYRCPVCGLGYIPMPITPNCPKCGAKADKVYKNFILDALDSAKYNAINQRTFLPGIWGTFTVGDMYYEMAFRFLTFAYKEHHLDPSDMLKRKIQFEKAQEIVTRYIPNVEMDGQTYMEPVVKAYLCALISSDYDTGNKE